MKFNYFYYSNFSELNKIERFSEVEKFLYFLPVSADWYMPEGNREGRKKEEKRREKKYLHGGIYSNTQVLPSSALRTLLT